MAKAKKTVVKIIPDETIITKIYVLHGQKVMLDKDLAVMYEVETKVFNQAVRRNIERFPEDFMFQLTKEEANAISRSQIVTLKQGQNIKYLPYAFTEQGVAMLSGVINSSKAIAMNIAIMRAFVEMKKLSSSNKLFSEKLKKIEYKLGTHDSQFAEIYEAFENLLDEKIEKEALLKNRKRIGFKPDE